MEIIKSPRKGGSNLARLRYKHLPFWVWVNKSDKISISRDTLRALPNLHLKKKRRPWPKKCPMKIGDEINFLSGRRSQKMAHFRLEVFCSQYKELLFHTTNNFCLCIIKRRYFWCVWKKRCSYRKESLEKLQYDILIFNISWIIF